MSAPNSAPGAPRECGCADGYFNSTQLYVCYADGFDRDQRDNAVAQSERAAATTGQACGACPTDVTGADCLICTNGQVALAAGFTIPTIEQATDSAQRRLNEGTSGHTSVFRCHIDIDLAKARCPANPEVPGTCSDGYTGTPPPPRPRPTPSPYNTHTGTVCLRSLHKQLRCHRLPVRLVRRRLWNVA